MKYKKGGFPFKKGIAKRNYEKEIGTPGQPGYEPPVKYEDLNEEGKKLWNELRNKKK